MRAPSKAMSGTLGSLLLAAACCATPSIALGQSAKVRSIVVQGESRSSEPLPTSPGDVLRSIEDPHSGERWLLFRNEQNPGGPGRLLPAGTSLERSLRVSAASSALATKRDHDVGAVILRAGDRLMVEEHTAIVDVSLEAVALEPVKAGATFSVRLKIGGQVERAVALAPGKAIFATTAPTTQVTP